MPSMRLGKTLLAAVLAVATIVLAACGSDSPSTSEEAPSVRGSWLITPQTPGPPFEALAAFGAGGVFITTGSDVAGTGIGQWVARGDNGFVFSYRNFHFDPDGKLASITTVNAEGTFDGDTLTGTASQSVVDASGGVIMEPQSAPFTGTRMVATAPGT
jgi:hypothetical protein